MAEGGETVEPILDAFGAYSTCAMFTVYNVRLGVAGTRLFVEFGAVRTAVDGRCPAQVFVLLILIGFREEAPRGVRIHSKSQQRPPSAFSDGDESRRRRERARDPRKHAKPPLRRSR